MDTLRLLENLRAGNKISVRNYELLESQIPPLVLAQALEERYNYSKNPVTLFKACEIYIKTRNVAKVAATYERLKEEHAPFVRENNLSERMISVANDLVKNSSGPTDLQEELEQDEAYRDFLEDSSRNIYRSRRQNETPSASYDYPYLETEDGFDDSY